MIEAVVFDLDGVLIDSEPVWEQVRRQFVAERGGHWASGFGAAPDHGHEHPRVGPLPERGPGRRAASRDGGDAGHRADGGPLHRSAAAHARRRRGRPAAGRGLAARAGQLVTAVVADRDRAGSAPRSRGCFRGGHVHRAGGARQVFAPTSTSPWRALLVQRRCRGGAPRWRTRRTGCGRPPPRGCG